MMSLNAAPYPENLLFFRRRRGGGDAQEPRRPTPRGRGPGSERAADLRSKDGVSSIPMKLQQDSWKFSDTLL